MKNSKYGKINSVNSLYLIIKKVNKYFKGINKNNYLTLFPTNEGKNILIVTRKMKNCGVKPTIYLGQ